MGVGCKLREGENRLKQSNGYAANRMAHGIRNVTKVMLSVFIVLFMVGSSFFVLATSQEIGPPMVWTDKEEYRVGESVLISGKGFWPVSQVTITLTHSSFPAPRVFIANVDSYGRFLLDMYAAEHVENPKEPIVVTAYQDATHQATTQFWEPDVTLLAWNLKDPSNPSNNQRWMKGDIKGYNEGDSVPMRVDVSGSAAGGPGKYINFTVAIDYLDFKGYYGFDGLTRMWDWTGQVPDAPYNIYSNNSQPFWVDPSEGTITWQSWIENAYPAGGDNILEQKWGFNLTVNSDATVRFGAHLAVTDIPHGILGASYYSGSSLHVRIADYITNFCKINEGNRDVPFAIKTILGPPQMHLEKSVDHKEVVEGQIITFTIHFNNTGEAEAQCINIWDNLPYVADIVPGSFLFWTQGHPPLAPVPAPTITDPQHWSWYIGRYPGVGDNGSSPVTESYLSFRALVNTSDEGCYKNWVYLNYTDDHGGDFPQLEAWAQFCIKGLPSIHVEKAGAMYAHVNETITYWINVTNDGSVNLTDVDVVDDVLGVIAQDITLEKGETRSFVVTHKVLSTDPDPLVNNVTATGHDRYDRQVNDTANHTVDILHPEIVVTKSSTKSCAKIGEKVWYTITLNNPSNDTDLFDVTVDDSLLGFHWSVPEFDAGEWEIFYPFVIVSEANEDPLNNTVHASGVDVTGFQVTDDANWTVDILHPSISLVKYANLSCAAENETVRYWVNASNPSNDTSMMVYLNDTMQGPLFAGVLAPGQYRNISYVYTVKPGDPTVIVNEAKVVAYDRQGHYVNVTVSWVLDVVHPSVEITKKVNISCAGIGENVTYTINVTNPAWTDVWLNGTIFDPLLDLEMPFTDLKPGESVLLEIEYTVKPADGVQGPLRNIAWVDAYDHQSHLKTAGASVDVDVVHPDIVVNKSADLACAGIGETIVYTITVYNPISADVWMNGTAHDAMLNWSQGFTNLRPGESQTWNVEYTVNATDGVEGYLENIAWVEAFDHQKHLATNQSKTVYVDIVHPAVEITKESNKKCAAPGENVTYWINVTNPANADVWLNGTARDLTVGVFWNFFNLTPGQTVSFLLNVSMPRVLDTYTNFAEVQAFDHQWHFLHKTANITVDVVHPDIQITKQVNMTCAAIGENVTYTITVTNPSWTDVWMNGTMYDEMLELQESFTNLTPGESISWIVEYTVKWYDGLQGPLENQASVVAYDHQLHERKNLSEVAYVDVVHPDVQVTKRANLTCAGIGESVNYTITVRNPGTADVWLNGTVYDSMLNWSRAFTNLRPGESLTWYVEYTVKASDGVQGYLENIAWVNAYDHQKHLVTNSSDLVLVDVVHPDIQILKTADKNCAHQGEEINFTITVTNPASSDVWMNGTVYDPLLQWVWTFTNLTPGSSVSKTMSYNVSRDYASHWLNNTASVEAYDHQHHLRLNRTYKEVEILHPQIDVTKVGPEFARGGQLIGYNVTVTNTGDTDLYDVVVWDSLFIAPIGSFAVLPMGWTEYINYTYPVPIGEGTVENLVTASGHDKQDVWVDDHANWTVVKLAMIDGHVYADLNTDLVMELLEPGLNNWLVVLTGTKAGGGSVFNTTHSDTNGFYQFLDLEPGTYTVTEMLEAGWYNISTRVSLPMTLVSGGSQTFDIGNLPYVNITGCKWADMNFNGLKDPNEVTIPNWNISLDGTDYNGYEVHLKTTTGPNGCYAFLMLLPGIYNVSEEVPAGWLNTTSAIRHVDVGTLEPANISGVDFGNVKLGTIYGFKYRDDNMNHNWDGSSEPGNQNGSEPRLPGWVIELTGTLNNGSSFGPIYDVTDENGVYQFDNLFPGVYMIREIMKPGWTNVTPDNYNVTMVAGGYFHCGKFGNLQYGSIQGWKYVDWDMDGVMDTNEPGIGGWNVTLTGWLNDGWPSGSEYRATHIGPITIQTDATGYWNFTNLLPGFYVVTEENRTHWLHVTPGEIGFDINSGTNVIDVKFGNVPYTCIWGYKFNDINGDGQNESEPGLIWTIVLNGTRADGTPVHIVMETRGDGYFATCFNVLPGEYHLYEVQDSDWMPTTPWIYEINLSEVIVPSAMYREFGNFELGKIGGYKYVDVNGNGTLDGGDVAKQGWTIFLSNGTHVWNTTTNENGWFEFTGLHAGTYLLWEENRTNWVHTSPAVVTGILITSGAVNYTTVFLNTELSKIWGYKFEDLNSNGVWDKGEPGVVNWTIWLWWDGVPPISTKTDASGYYEFAGLMPANATVWEENNASWTHTNETWESFDITSGTNKRVHDFGNFENVKICIWKYEDVDGNGRLNCGDKPLANWTFTITGPAFSTPLVLSTDEHGRVCVNITKAGEYNVSEESRQGWINTTTSFKLVNITSGILLRPLKFGNFELVRLVVKKYYDGNMNGHDDSEPGLNNWPITVQPMGVTLYTDTNGDLTLDGLGPGAYVVSEALPAGWKNTTPSVINVGSVTSGQVVSLSFGNVVLGNITGCKFYDKDMDGIRDANEPLLSGWTIHLDGVTDWGVVVNKTTTTNETGYYEFVEVQPGLYTVSEELKSCFWVNTTSLVQTVDVSGLREEFNETRDFGNMRYSVIYGYKFLDTYAERYPYWPNGVFDENEIGIGNWRITLEGRTLTGQLVQRVAYTNNTDEKLGFYIFGKLLPGDYWVNETMLSDWWATTPFVNLVRIYADWRTPVIMRIDFGNLLPEPDPEIPFVLAKGWNMWSSPLTTTNAMYASDLAAKIGPTVVKISRLNTASGKYEAFVPGVTTPRSALDFQILYGVGYYIVVRSDTYFTLIGTLHPTSSLDLAKGWNIVGYTTLAPMKASDLVSHVSGCKVYKVSYLDSATGKYYAYVPGVSSPDKDFVITSGRAYFVVTNGIGTLGIGT
jgi:serine-aspartate repeat-containing protein C/D/E